VEEFLEYFDVGNLDADITVQCGSDQASDQVHDIAGGLPVVWRETLHDGVVCVLALVGVHKDAEEHVDHIDEDVGAENSFPEIPWVTHLGEERDEEHGSTVAIHCLIETV